MSGYIVEPKDPASQAQGGWAHCNLTAANPEILHFGFFPLSFPLQIRGFRAWKSVEVFLRHPLRHSAHTRASPAAAGPQSRIIRRFGELAPLWVPKTTVCLSSTLFENFESLDMANRMMRVRIRDLCCSKSSNTVFSKFGEQMPQHMCKSKILSLRFFLRFP